MANAYAAQVLVEVATNDGTRVDRRTAGDAQEDAKTAGARPCMHVRAHTHTQMLVSIARQISLPAVAKEQWRT